MGLTILMGRMKAGKHVCEEVQVLLKERAAIEEEYGKRLKKLAKSFNPKEEIGYISPLRPRPINVTYSLFICFFCRTLRESLDVVRNELEKTGQSRLDLAAEIKIKLEKPLAELIVSQSNIRRNVSLILILPCQSILDV